MADTHSFYGAAVSSSSENAFEKQNKAKDDAATLSAVDNQVGAAEIHTLRSGSGQSSAQDVLPSLDLVDVAVAETVGSTAGAAAEVATLATARDGSKSAKQQYEEQSSWLDAAYEVGSGMVDEVVNHPGEVATNVAIGVAVGVGAALLAPEVAVCVAVAGVAYGAYEVYDNIGSWFSDADTVANQQGRTQEEIAAAKAGLRDLGGGLTEVAAGAVGGGIGSVTTVGLKNVAERGVAGFFNTAAEALPMKLAPATPVGHSSVLPTAAAVAFETMPTSAVDYLNGGPDY